MIQQSHFPASVSKEKCSLSLKAVRDNTVLILTMQAGENRFNETFGTALLEALAEIRRIALHVHKTGPKPLALVTVGEGKFFSNGLDIPKVFPIIEEYIPAFVHPILLGFMSLPIPTVAAINGHAFAGGFLLAAAHDYRVMRTDRGYLCMNEVELPAPLSPGMAAVLRAKFTSPAALRDCLLHARRFSAQEALDLNLVDVVAPEAEVLPRALDLALTHASRACAGEAYGQLKEEMWSDAVDKLKHGGNGFAKARL
ncbi:MAG: ClpP/crotonase-like domain-containing protein [Piptocephalis tieghemiana]|nr:MAG: ClpP/crotonase-like domain-containing protein [Piptocephalis tieghemiana]